MDQNFLKLRKSILKYMNITCEYFQSQIFTNILACLNEHTIRPWIIKWWMAFSFFEIFIGIIPCTRVENNMLYRQMNKFVDLYGQIVIPRSIIVEFHNSTMHSTSSLFPFFFEIMLQMCKAKTTWMKLSVLCYCSHAYSWRMTER